MKEYTYKVTDKDITIHTEGISLIKLKNALKLRYEFHFHIHKWIVYNYFDISRLQRVCSKCGKQEVSNDVLPSKHVLFINKNIQREDTMKRT